MLRTPATDEEAKGILERSKPEWLGNFGEAIWSRVLAASGWHYISLTKICEGGAPLARGAASKIILPDFQAFANGKMVMVEAKAKSQSIVYRKTKKERHGINENNYVHYKQIEKGTGRPCCIAVVELRRESVEDLSLSWSGSLLIERMSELGEPASEFPENPRKVYWQRKLFHDLDSYTPRELFQLANGERTADFSFELSNVLFPAKQQGLFA